MVTSQKPKITARIRDELQRTVAAVCLDIVYKMGDSMKKIEMYNRVFKLYHGSNDGSVAYSHLFCCGDGVFSDAWEEDSNNGMILRTVLSQIPLSQGIDVTKEIMERRNFVSTELVAGRNLVAKAKLVAKNSKKAFAIVKKYLTSDGNPKFSGWTVERVLDTVNNEMWEVLGGGNETNLNDKNKECELDESFGADDEGNEDNEEDRSPITVVGNVHVNDSSSSPVVFNDSAVDENDDLSGDDEVEAAAGTANPNTDDLSGEGEEEAAAGTANPITDELKMSSRPQDWFYPGFFALVLFGPLAGNDHRLGIFSISDPDKNEKKKSGRRAVRDQKAKHEAFERSREENRGMSAVETALLGIQETQRANQVKSRLESRIFSLNLEADRIVRLIGMSGITEERRDNLFTKLDAVQQKIEDADEKWQSLEDDSNLTQNSVSNKRVRVNRSD